MSNKTKYLGIDFGLKRIGISISDEQKKIAFPRDYYLNDNKIFDNLFRIVTSENVCLIVIGLSSKLNSKNTHSTNHILLFKEQLENFFNKKNIDIKVKLFDERFSSNLASYYLKQSSIRKKVRKNKGLLDSLSAQIILQDYLDKENSVK